MANLQELLPVILIMAGVTFLTRSAPFILLSGKADHPMLQFLARYIPPAIMTLLVLYSFGSVEFATSPFGLPELTAAMLTVGTHLLWRHALLSICVGTAFYMVAVQQLI
ncbi:MAG: AzlD domain-containing protein [Gammaproteobacteria bacterium]|nr:AzlD domain-containing protein [Gammaproteobacteria bacterium]